MAYIGRGIDNLSNIEVLDVITFTDSAGPYNILKGGVAFIPSATQNLLIEVDGIIQASASYTTTGSTITFGVSMASSSVMNSFLHLATGLITTPGDGTVSSVKIVDDAVTTAKILDNNVTVAKLPTTLDVSGNTVTLPASVGGLGTGITNAQLAGSITDAKITGLASSKLSGLVPVVNLGTGTASASTYLAGDQSYKALSEYDDDAIRNDIATLALHQATNANAAKYNLINTNVDQYEDSAGIASFTTCSRNAAGEYVASVEAAEGIDENTVMMLHFETAPAATIVDSSDNSGDITITKSGSAATDATQKKFGTYALHTEQATADYILTGNLSSGLTRAFPTTGDFTVDFWAYHSTHETSNRLFSIGNDGGTGGGQPVICMGISAGSPNDMNFHSDFGSNSPAGESDFTDNGVWNHWAMQRTSGNLYGYFNGKIYWDNSGSGQDFLDGVSLMQNDDNVFVAARSASSAEHFRGYIDEFRISNISRYAATAATGTQVFTPETAAYSAGSVNASGNYVSTATIANASVSTMGAVITYKNFAGTNTLNTDIVLEVSANGGTNYTTAVLTAGGTFSTGILQAVANDIVVTAGTSIQYRISFANQDAAKTAHIYGASLMY